MTTIQQQPSGILINALQSQTAQGQQVNLTGHGIDPSSARCNHQGVWQAQLLEINDAARHAIKQVQFPYSSADLATVKSQRQALVGQLESLQKARKENRSTTVSEAALKNGIAFLDAMLANKTLNPSYVGRTVMVMSSVKEHLLPSLSTVAKTVAVVGIAATAFMAGSVNSGQMHLPHFGNFTIPFMG